MFSFICCAKEEDAGREVVLEEPEVTPDTGDADPQAGIATPLTTVVPEPQVSDVCSTGVVEKSAVDPAPVLEERAQDGDEQTQEVVMNPDMEDFQVECTKKTDADLLGLNVIRDKQALVVTSLIPGGMIERWNSANPKQQVKYGSVIYATNGVCGGLKAQLEEIVRAETLTLKVCRHNRYTVIVEKKKVLGLDLQPDSMTVSGVTRPTKKLLAKDISLHGWNTDCPEGLEIISGDQLVEVNGLQGAPTELLEKVNETSGELKLVFARA